jgi:hypothetical protein
VREILSDPAAFDIIDGVVAADSIYAGLEEGRSDRRVDARNMQDFRRFAQLACDSRKTFIVSHSALRTSYASTAETADDLLSFVGLTRETITPQQGNGMRLVSRASRGRFIVLGYEGDTGEAHMEHLRQIGTWWKMLR